MASATPEAQIKTFLAKFDPAMAARIREARAAMRKLFPTAVELVYDNYNFLVFGFCTSPRASDCIASIAANSKGIALSFYWGSSLKDPQKILQGSGSQNRFIRLPDAGPLADPYVRELLNAAVQLTKSPLPETKGYTVIQSVSEKQRPRK